MNLFIYKKKSSLQNNGEENISKSVTYENDLG